MNEDPASTQVPQRSWLERLSKALFREPQDREQLIALLRDAQQKNILDAEALAMIEGVLRVSTMRVRDIMIPRSLMVVIEYDATPEEILPIIIESEHSRYPVIGENRDEVVGLLLAKDLLTYYAEKQDKPFNIKDILRPVVFVPESKRLDVMLREFRLKRNHMALVVDEYGGIAGLITIEDVLEEIVGEIEDEYDVDDEPQIQQQGDKVFLVKALTPIEDFNEYFNDNLSDQEFDTIGGYVMNQYGYLPKRGETIQFGKYKIKILNADNRRIRLLRVQVK